jgi:hypothetical protein
VTHSPPSSRPRPVLGRRVAARRRPRSRGAVLMPYTVEKSGDEYCVVRSGNSSQRKRTPVVPRHQSRCGANRRAAKPSRRAPALRRPASGSASSPTKPRSPKFTFTATSAPPSSTNRVCRRRSSLTNSRASTPSKSPSASTRLAAQRGTASPSRKPSCGTRRR